MAIGRKVLVDPRIELLWIEVANDYERRVVRTVVSGMKLLDVFKGRGVEIFNTADAWSFVRMFEERLLLEQVFETTVRRREHSSVETPLLQHRARI